MSKRKIIAFLCSVAAIAMVVGSWAYYTSTNAIENKLQTSQFGNELVEKFTPITDWQPGSAVTKEVGVENTGDYDLFVRVKMSETWTAAGGATVTVASNATGTPNPFLPADANTSRQLSATDGLIAGDGSVVYKKLSASANWYYNQGDGYWYYMPKLTKQVGATPTATGTLLESITLCGNTDMGIYTETKYYTTAATRPANTAIGSNPATQWVVYTGAVPAGTTFTRSVSKVNSATPGYSGASYVLTITSETLQATKEAFQGTAAWNTTPANVRAAWGVN